MWINALNVEERIGVTTFSIEEVEECLESGLWILQ